MEALELDPELLPVGTTPVHIAINTGQVGTLQSLLERDPSLVNQPDQFGCSPLAKALQNGRVEAAQILIECGAHLDSPYSNNPQPTLAQVLLSKPTFLPLLYSSIESNSTIHIDLSSILPNLAYEGNVDILEAVLGMQPGINIDFIDHLKCSALHYACSRGFLNIVKILMEHGANRKLKSSVGCTALHLACSAGHREVVAAILTQSSGDTRSLLNSKNSAGNTPVMCALNNQKLEVVCYLLTAYLEQLELDEILPNGHALTGYCFYLKYLALQSSMRSMFSSLPLPCLSVEESQWLLHESIHTDNLSGVKEALAHGASVKCLDCMLHTPLMLAAKLGSVEMCKCLVENGADPSVIDVSGKTALVYAFEHGKHEAVAFLISHPSSGSLNPHFAHPIATSDMLSVLISHFEEAEGTKCVADGDWLAWLALAVPTATAELFQALVKVLAPPDWIEQMVSSSHTSSSNKTEVKLAGRGTAKCVQLPAYVQDEVAGESYKPRPKLVRSFSQPRKWHFARAPPSTSLVWRFKHSTPRPKKLPSCLREKGPPFTWYRAKWRQQGHDSVIHTAALHNLDILRLILTSCQDSALQERVLLSRDRAGRTALELVLPQFSVILDACESLELNDLAGLDQFLSQEFPLPESLLFEEALLHYLCVGMLCTELFIDTYIVFRLVVDMCIDVGNLLFFKTVPTQFEGLCVDRCIVLLYI